MPVLRVSCVMCSKQDDERKGKVCAIVCPDYNLPVPLIMLVCTLMSVFLARAVTDRCSDIQAPVLRLASDWHSMYNHTSNCFHWRVLPSLVRNSTSAQHLSTQKHLTVSDYQHQEHLSILQILGNFHIYLNLWHNSCHWVIFTISTGFGHDWATAHCAEELHFLLTSLGWLQRVPSLEQALDVYPTHAHPQHLCTPRICYLSFTYIYRVRLSSGNSDLQLLRSKINQIGESSQLKLLDLSGSDFARFQT